MTISIRYFITDANGNLIDWYNRTGVALLDILGKEAQVFGSGEADAVFVQAGASANLSELSGGNDKIYLSGQLNHYQQSINQETGVYILTRNAGLQPGQTEVITFTVGGDDDVLYFADGHISLNAATNNDLYDANNSEFKQISLSALQAGGTPSEPPALNTPTTSTSPVNVFVDDSSGVNVPQAPQTGQALKVYGSGADDKVYVRKGTSVDASELSGGNDKVYLTGKLSDYHQSIDQDTGVYTLTRTAGLDNGIVEIVTFTVGGEDDELYFADGRIVLNAANNSSIYDGNLAEPFKKITLQALDAGETTPGLSDIQAVAIDTPNTTSGADLSNSTLNAGDTLVISVAMKKAVDVAGTGAPKLGINVGGTTVQALSLIHI